ncbi:d-lactate dehydrogenase-like protein [Leptomonas pyrrhocoris]|uniref:D-lactate dehydrogenase-like protein n=1 Tax=Leptomonas pyrrhocoris TaxID=157538 RepID=A0A0M9G7P3_LEPPY|nr:d-lactate dehydrogenase-like protein [Leptomonas pyrrhocoris]KPA84267.1 d-lactate dehydrogenase-like protein [Leptomonas pyrrhocoris]|eukprot:XP_015662706.1 d-lactate dehydrogenase-like protein [Leptomonas pyrrhocoris]
MNKEIVIGANSYNKLKLPPMTLVLLEFTSNDWWLRDIKRDYRFVEAIFKEAGHPTQMRYLRPGKETEDVWTARRQCHFSAMHARGAKGPEKCFGTDICVPLPKLTEMIDFTEEKFQEANKACYLCAHISDGNYHLIIPYADKAEFELLQSIEEKMIKKAIALGGTITGEHGIGCCKVCYVVQEHGQAHIDVQEAIKKALDTDNVMNPGCFYPSQVAQYHPSHL